MKDENKTSKTIEEFPSTDKKKKSAELKSRLL